jgi:hypothetical protein
MALRNDDERSPIRAILVRQSLQINNNWSAKSCYERKNALLLDTHGTQENWNINKCSFALSINKDPRSSSHWYWTRVKPGLEALYGPTGENAKHYNYGLFLLLHASGKRFELNIFLQRKRGPYRLDDDQIRTWKSLYVDALYAGLFENRVLPNQRLLALNYPGEKPFNLADKELGGVNATTNKDGLSTPLADQPSHTSKPTSSIAVSPQRDTVNEQAQLNQSQKRPFQAQVPALTAPATTGANEASKLASLEAELARMREVIKELQLAKSSVPNESLSKSGNAVVTPKARERYGLVIGNAAYKNVPVLDNSNKDAQAFANALKELGFKTSLHLDLSQRSFNKAVREFKDNLQGGEEVVFYFAGHGVQLGSTNYLLPTDVGGDSADQVKDEAIELQRVLDSLSEKEMKFSLAVIDACRDNPFKGSRRAIGGRGLAPTSAATGQMIIFSAGAGQQALDRLGPTDKEPNGLFTRVFLKQMQKPGVPVDSMLREVRKEVVSLAKSVGHEQVPALYDQTVGEFYFKVQ